MKRDPFATIERIIDIGSKAALILAIVGFAILMLVHHK